MESKHVTIYLPSLNGGGAERMMLNISAELANRGHCVDLVLVEKKGDYIAEIPNTVTVIDLESPRTLFSLPKFLHYLWNEEPDAVLSTLRGTNIASILGGILVPKTIHTVIREANPPSEKMKHSANKDQFLGYMSEKLYSYADHIVAISAGVKKDLVEAYRLDPVQVSVVYNPAFSSDIESRSKQSINEPWFHDDIPVILGTGRLADEKDFNTLLEAFAIIKESMEARLIILGEGPKRNEFECLISDSNLENHIKLPGFVENPFRYMANADVFALSSKYEGFGNVLIEAMACGTPVVSTDCPYGPAEILANGKYGILVPTESPAKLAKGIAFTLENPVPSSSLKRRASEFSVTAAVDKYEQILCANKNQNP